MSECRIVVLDRVWKKHPNIRRDDFYPAVRNIIADLLLVPLRRVALKSDYMCVGCEDDRPLVALSISIGADVSGQREMLYEAGVADQIRDQIRDLFQPSLSGNEVKVSINPGKEYISSNED